MKNSRKQVIQQIAMMDKILQCQKSKVIKHKEYFAQSHINRYHLTTLMLLVAAFFLGWEAERKQYSNKALQQILDIGTLLFFSFFKKTLVTLFK